MTMGVERPPSSFFFHSKLLPSPPSGSHFSTSPFSIETRFCCGPRQLGQSSGSGVDARAREEKEKTEVAASTNAKEGYLEPKLMIKTAPPGTVYEWNSA